MRPTTRILLVLVLCGAALPGQFLLVEHLRAAAEAEKGQLDAPLAALPERIGDWIGRDVEIDPETLYADDHLHRVYVHGRTGQQVSLWLAHSATGEDRGHHPEVCMAISGLRERPGDRGVLDVPGHEAPVQEYCFVGTNRSQWVYYWHYTLPSTAATDDDPLRELYRVLNDHPSSVTLEVFTGAKSETELDAARSFVRAVDAAFQSHLPGNAVRGSWRLPVTITEGAPPGARR